MKKEGIYFEEHLNVELEAESDFDILRLASCDEFGTLSRKRRRDSGKLLNYEI